MANSSTQVEEFAMLWTLSCLLTLAPAGQPVYTTGFDGDQPLAGWQLAGGTIAVENGALKVSLPAPGSARAVRELPVAGLAGQLITISARVKAEGVTAKPRPWNGIKVMLVLELPAGREYPQIELPVGTFDWVTRSRTLRLPADIKSAQLTLGLEEVGGTVWFDQVMIEPFQRPGGVRSEVMFKGHDRPRLRGAMFGPRFSEQNLRDLAALGANHIRWQLNWTPMKEAEAWAADIANFDKWLDGALEEADKGLALAKELGLVVLLDLHTPPGGRKEAGVCRMFSEKQYQEHFLAVWRKIATRYKGHPEIWAYDLVNEPVEGPVAADCLNWRDLATAAGRIIREIEPGKPLLVETSPWGGPTGFDQFAPLPLDNVIYGFHMYLPHEYTHQGVHNLPTGLTYPGKIGNREWDKEALRQAMLAPIEFQKTFNVHIHVGEFSVARWAAGGAQYLRDLIDLFEEYGWDWAYHAWREWDGWSVEHGPDPADRQRVTEPTDRGRVLFGWFARNKQP